jgi:hypothetical protein
MRKRYWQDIVNIGIGLWLFVATASRLQHSMAIAPMWHFMTGAWPPEPVGIAAMWILAIVGVAIAFVACFAWLAFSIWQEWTNLALGVWLSVSPWILGFSSSAVPRWNAVITGVIVAALAAWVLTLERGSKRAVK